MAVDRRSSQNHFLDHLGPEDFNLLKAFLSDAEFSASEVVSEVGAEMAFVWFPTTAVFSVVTTMGDGQDIETGTIGHESAFGLLNALGSPISTNRVVAQVAGRAWRMPATRLRAAAAISVAVTDSIIRHTQAAIGQIQQIAACNALHQVEARLCRLLLMTADRTRNPRLRLTQEFLGYRLGVQRTTVTSAAQVLQTAGYIRYSRGSIDVLDRDGLLARACECYGAMFDIRSELLDARPSRGNNLLSH